MTLNFPSIVRQLLRKVSRAEAVELELDPSQVAASTTKVLSRRSDMHKELRGKEVRSYALIRRPPMLPDAPCKQHQERHHPEGLCTLLRGRAASFLRTVALAGPFHAKEQEEWALNNRCLFRTQPMGIDEPIG